MGFDPLNRDELGGNWSAVHSLLSSIKRSGWSDSETQHAMCGQIIPNDKEVEDWNRRLVANVPLAPIEKGQLEYSSFSCGHTNSGLNAVLAACPNKDPRLSIDDKLSKEHIGKTDKPFAKAVDRGLKWKILHYSVRIIYPEALVILISSYSVYGSVQQKTSEVQGLLQMYRLCKQMSDCGKDPDWEQIKATILKGEPPFAADIDYLCEFLVAKAGKSEEVTHLRSFVASHRQFVPVNVRIPGAVFGVLAEPTPALRLRGQETVLMIFSTLLRSKSS